MEYSCEHVGGQVVTDFIVTLALIWAAGVTIWLLFLSAVLWTYVTDDDVPDDPRLREWGDN